MVNTIKEKFIEIILKNTKDFVHNSENFHDHYSKKLNKSFYKNQLPLLTQSKLNNSNNNIIKEEKKQRENKFSLKKKYFHSET